MNTSFCWKMAMGQKSNRTPVNFPIPTKMGSKMGGAPAPKWDPIGFDPQPNQLGTPLRNNTVLSPRGLLAGRTSHLSRLGRRGCAGCAGSPAQLAPALLHLLRGAEVAVAAMIPLAATVRLPMPVDARQALAGFVKVNGPGLVPRLCPGADRRS